MKLRKLTGNDMKALALLYEGFWGEKSSEEKMRKLYSKLEKDERYLFLGAFDDDRLAGSVMGVVCEELYGECKPFLVVDDLIVAEDYRRKGVARALMEEVQDFGIKAECYQVLMITENDRLDAIRFYQSMGFDPEANRGYKKKLTVVQPG